MEKNQQNLKLKNTKSWCGKTLEQKNTKISKGKIQFQMEIYQNLIWKSTKHWNKKNTTLVKKLWTIEKVYNHEIGK